MQVLGGVLHLGLQTLHQALFVFLVHLAAHAGEIFGFGLSHLGGFDDFADFLIDCRRCDAMLLVISNLNRPAAFGLADRFLHGVRDTVAVHNNTASRVTGCPADCLDQGTL
ncbi:hypothetical protein D3C75_972090 [compost metagenome]